jgi:hypothetical protein
MTEEFEEIGVVLSLDRRGRHNAHRVFLNGGRVVKREAITLGRNGSKALEEALRNLGLVLHENGRGVIAFAQPEALKMILEHK